MVDALLLGGLGLGLSVALGFLVVRRWHAVKPFQYGEDAQQWQAAMDLKVEECRARRL